MARPLRIEYPGAWYHVTCRENEKKDIFGDNLDRVRFLEILERSVNLYSIQVHAYVLMPNHFHLLLTTPEANLNSFMQRFNTAYTVFYNRRHERSGHLYQGRYKAILVGSDSYLLELSRYVHLNPARIKKNSRLEVGEKKKIISRYPWSSYLRYVSLKQRKSYTVYEKILTMLGGGDDRRGRNHYKQFVLGGIGKEKHINIWEDIRGQMVLGSDEFVEWIYDRFLSGTKVDKRELPGLKELETGPETVEEIAQYVSAEFGVPEKELYGSRSAHRAARSVFMELCCSYLARKMSFSEIGRRLGRVSGSALSRNRERLSSRIEDDPKLKAHFKKLNQILASGLSH
jgi:REP element-mobilizing transposase RayT